MLVHIIYLVVNFNPFSIGNPSSNAGFSIVTLGFFFGRGGNTLENEDFEAKVLEVDGR